MLRIYSGAMTNRFGVTLHPDDVRWAAAEGVSETVIAAVVTGARLPSAPCS